MYKWYCVQCCVAVCNTAMLEKTLCKWDIYVPLVMKGLIQTLNEHLKLLTIFACWASVILKLFIPWISVWVLFYQLNAHSLLTQTLSEY
jgi:hypothetical protein